VECECNEGVGVGGIGVKRVKIERKMDGWLRRRRRSWIERRGSGKLVDSVLTPQWI